MKKLKYFVICFSLLSALFVTGCSDGSSKELENYIAYISLKKAPEKDNSGVPEKDNSGAPEKDNSGAPEKDNSEVPEKDNSEVPEKDNSEVPEKDNSGVPEKDNSEAPVLSNVVKSGLKFDFSNAKAIAAVDKDSLSRAVYSRNSRALEDSSADDSPLLKILEDGSFESAGQTHYRFCKA